MTYTLEIKGERINMTVVDNTGDSRTLSTLLKDVTVEFKTTTHVKLSYNSYNSYYNYQGTWDNLNVVGASTTPQKIAAVSDAIGSSGTGSTATSTSTDTLQVVGNVSLNSIDTKTPALVSGKVPVDLTFPTDPNAVLKSSTKGASISAGITSTDVTPDIEAVDVFLRGNSTTLVNNSIQPSTTSGTLMLGYDATNVRAIKTDSAGAVEIVATVFPLPTGASTSALQTLGNAALSTIDTNTAETSTNTLSIDTKIPVQGQALMAASLPVVIASDQTNVPANTVQIGGTAVDVNSGTNSNGTQRITLATDDQLNIRTGSVTETAPATDTASSGLNGRLQRVAQRLTSLIAQLPATLGVKTSANSMSVVIASDDAQFGTKTTAATAQTGGAGLLGWLSDLAVTTRGFLTNTTASFTKLTDGTNDGTVKAASTAPVDTDTALVVSVSPNTPTNGTLAPTATPTTMSVIGGTYNTTAPAATTGQSGALQTDANLNLKVTAPYAVGTHTSGTIATGGTAQTITTVIDTDKYFEFQNRSDTDMTLSFTTTATATNGIRLKGETTGAGGTYTLPANLVLTGAVSIFCATTGKAYTFLKA